MKHAAPRKKVFGWFFFDWASQPFHTLIITFIFGPYVKELLGSGTETQTVWGYGLATTSVIIALVSPLLGVAADCSGRRMPWIVFFSSFYVLGSAGLWWSQPEHFNINFLLFSFGVGMAGVELTTVFTNAMMPDLVDSRQMGKLSGSGWAFGYVGGVLALALMLCFFAQGATGKTYLGIDPIFGLNADTREGTRFVGPFTALWYILFMIPFFLWVKEPRRERVTSVTRSLRQAWPAFLLSWRRLARQPYLFVFLIASMFYRDALSGAFIFGGIYAVGVMGWTVVDTGIFGVLAASSGAVFAWLGGKADLRYGSKAVIITSNIILGVALLVLINIQRERILGIPVSSTSTLPDLLFYICGSMIGAVGGALQASSRTMMIHQAPPEHVSEVCALYALAGKTTAFLAPLLVAIATGLTKSQQLGVSPLLLLLIVGLWLLRKVKVQPETDQM